MSRDLRSALNRIGEFRTSDGRFDSLGADAESRIRALMSPLSTIEVVSAIFHYSKIPAIEFNGHLVDKDKRVTMTNNALAAVTSIALSSTTRTGAAPQLLTRVGMKERAGLAVMHSSLCFNDETDFGPPSRTDEFNRLLHSLVPTSYLQDKVFTTPRNLLARAASWYSILPSDPANGCPPPPALNAFVRSEYGVDLAEIGLCIPFFWAASEIGSVLLWKRTFSSIQNWATSAPKRLLDRFSVDPSIYSSPWLPEPTLPNRLAMRIPRIIDAPIIRVGMMEGEPVYSMPFPRAIFNHFEESFYWRCFDHFLVADGRPDNTFSNWFGRAFEAYCFKLLAAVATPRLSSLKYLEASSIPAPDAMEELASTVLFFEFKARRIHRKHLLYWTAQSEAQMTTIAQEIIEQFIRFAECWAHSPNHPLKKAIKPDANVQFVVLTPGPFPINPFIRKKNLFAAELEKIRTCLGIRKSPKIVFSGLKDIEALGRTKKNGIHLGPIWKRFMNETPDPYMDFWDWYLRNEGKAGQQNPLITRILDETQTAALSALQFS